MILYWRRYGKAGGCQIKIKIFYILIGGCSSVGRAPALQAGGHEFESHHLHWNCKTFRLTEIAKQFLMHERHCAKCYCTLKTSYRRFWWKWFFIKTSENIVNKVYDQTKRTKVQDRSNSIRVIKRKDPVSNAIETVNEVKQKRAQGGCLGTKSRWKTW